VSTEEKIKTTISFHFFFFHYAAVHVTRWVTSKIGTRGANFQSLFFIRLNCFLMKFSVACAVWPFNQPLSVESYNENSRLSKYAE